MSSTWQGRLVRSLNGHFVLWQTFVSWRSCVSWSSCVPWRSCVSWSGVVTQICFALASTWSSRALAQSKAPTQAVYVAVEGTCPRPETLRRELEPLLKVWELRDSKEEAHEVVRIRDRTSSLEISALGDVRVVNDPGGDCQERARVAAVFIALRLEPAHLPHEEPPTKRLDSDAPAVVAQGAQESFKPSVGLGVLVERSAGPIGWTLGPVLSAGVSKGKALGYFSGSFTSATTLVAEDVDLRFLRIPFDFGAGYALRKGPWTFAPILSIALDYFTVRAPGLADARTHGRLEMGSRLSLLVERSLGSVRLFGAARFAWFPRGYVVEVDPLGEVFQTPPIWVGVSSGISFRLPE